MLKTSPLLANSILNSRSTTVLPQEAPMSQLVKILLNVHGYKHVKDKPFTCEFCFKF